jgi:hypothetical protein
MSIQPILPIAVLCSAVLSPPCVLTQRLCADPSNEVLIFSGSEMAKLEETFGGLPLWLAAENGVYVRPPIRPELPQVGLGFAGARGGGARQSQNVDFWQQRTGCTCDLPFALSCHRGDSLFVL